ncbi:MAG: type II toxin-antitoxin system VapC family toxin [Anaerolineae bacterium]|jgi:predicted nucleic acid-binding protein
MDNSLILDTSVVLKWFRQGEILSDQALSLRDAYLDGRITVTLPALVAYELANVLCYKHDLTTDQVQAAVRSLFDMGLDWFPPSSDTLRRAIELARAYDTTVYDATFAAAAEALNATFVTADKQLAHSLKAFTFVRFLGELGYT